MKRSTLLLICLLVFVALVGGAAAWMYFSPGGALAPVTAEDAVQETFLRLLRSAPELGSETHEKAWLIVTARNVCKNELARARRREVPLEEAPAHYVPELSDTLLALRSLPEKYRLPLYLYYYEGYSTAETAEMLGKPAATVRSDLRRGRERMKALLGGDF